MLLKFPQNTSAIQQWDSYLVTKVQVIYSKVTVEFWLS
jgi:hypothetical protein